MRGSIQKKRGSKRRGSKRDRIIYRESQEHFRGNKRKGGRERVGQHTHPYSTHSLQMVFTRLPWREATEKV